MSPHRSRSCFCAAVVCIIFAGATHATTIARMSLAQLAQTSPEIVRAQCVANSTGWDAGEIWTFTTFEVQETWRGGLSGKITVRLLGGRTEKVTSFVSGIPRFHTGEDVVLFLEPTSRGDFSVVSWEQGTFRVHRAAVSTEESVTQDTASFETFDPRVGRFVASGIRAMPILTFRSEVEAALAGATKALR